MAEDSGQERTEQATPKRLREAREKGDIARSRELATMAVLLAAALGLLMTGRYAVERMASLMRQGLAVPRAVLLDPALLPQWLGHALTGMLLVLAPVLAILVVAALAGQFALGGVAFSPAGLAPKLEKLDPVKGLQRLFSWRALAEFLKAIAKCLLVGVVAVLVLRHEMPRLLMLGREPLQPALADAVTLLVHAFVWLASALVLVAAADVPFQLWDHARKLRMTRQELRDEAKETEGNPQMRARVRQVQREMARRRMMEAVPTADVVITNPTHYAVALSYDDSRAGAPRLVAKGADLIAAEIRRRAEAAAVPVVPAPPLARAIFHNTELDQEIPRALYLAVAQVLAYVYQLRAGAHPAPLPALRVPAELSGNQTDSLSLEGEG